MSHRTRFLTRFFDPSEIDPENRGTLLLLAGLGVMVFIAILLIGYGYYNSRIKPNSQAVLKIGEQSISYSQLTDRVDAEIAGGTFNTTNLQTGIASIMGVLQREGLVRIAAQDKGVSASKDEIDAAMRKDLGLPDDAGSNVVAQQLQTHLIQTGLSLNQYRQILEASVLEQKLKDSLAADVPAEGEQVNLQLIQLSSQADADKAKQRLDNGEDFGAVAAEMSVDQTKSSGGNFGWAPRGLLPSKMEDVVFGLNGRSDVVQLDQGFFIFNVTDKQTRPIDSSLKDRVVNAELTQLLADTKDKVGVSTPMTVGQLNKLASHIRGKIPSQPQAPAQQVPAQQAPQQPAATQVPGG